MRLIEAVVNNTKVAWTEASTFPISECLRLWWAGSAPDSIRRLIGPTIQSRPRGEKLGVVSEARVFVAERHGFRGLRPDWLHEAGERWFRDTYSLRQTRLSPEGYYAPQGTAGPLLVKWCEQGDRWLGAPLEEDWDAWSLNLRLLFGRHCHQVGNDDIFELPDRVVQR